VLAGAGWGAVLAIVGAALSVLLTVVWFDRWLVVNVAIDVAIIVLAL
jgi:hypothetical protein